MCTAILPVEQTIEHLDFDTTCSLKWIIKKVDKDCTEKAIYSATVKVNVPSCHWEPKFLCQSCYDKLVLLVGTVCIKCGEYYASSSYILQDIVRI